MNDVTDSISITGFSDDEAAVLRGFQELAEQERARIDNPSEEKPKEEKKSEFEERELLAIFDALITQGSYIETISVGKRMRVAWRSRTVGEANAITRLVDTAGFNTVVAVQNHTNVLNMAYSLVGFNGTDFSKTPLTERKAFIENMPEALIIQLSRSLARFDYKISKATEVGQENF